LIAVKLKELVKLIMLTVVEVEELNKL